MTWTNNRRAVLLLAGATLLSAGMPEAQARVSSQPLQSDGAVYYLDGAGGGGLFVNWGRRFKRGLEEGGFRGEFHSHDWQTGLGPLLDHTMSEQSKRAQARDLASDIVEYMDKQPGEPVHLIGLSAGTVVLVYTLEALPPEYQVDTAVLISSSVRGDYDLRRALRGVKGRMYVFVSQRDSLLQSLMPAVGTASVAGLGGFVMPPAASQELRGLYAKLTHVHWRPEFARYGHSGSHTGATHPEFVRHYLVPMLKRARATATSRPVDRPESSIWTRSPREPDRR